MIICTHYIVIIKYNFSVDLADFILQSSNSSYWRSIAVSTTSNDAVLVYVSINSEWHALPFNNYWNTGTYFNEFYYSIYSTSTILLYIRNWGGSAPYYPMSGLLNYRVYVIQGSSTAKAVVPESLNQMNMFEVERYYRLKN